MQKVAGSSPVTGDHDLLAARELELGAAEGLLALRVVHVLAADGQQDLANRHTRAHALRLAEGSAHSSLQQRKKNVR